MRRRNAQQLHVWADATSSLLKGQYVATSWWWRNIYKQIASMFPYQQCWSTTEPVAILWNGIKQISFPFNIVHVDTWQPSLLDTRFNVCCSTVSVEPCIKGFMVLRHVSFILSFAKINKSHLAFTSAFLSRTEKRPTCSSTYDLKYKWCWSNLELMTITGKQNYAY